MKQLICYFDGCCEPRNPGGNMGTGAAIFAVSGSTVKKDDQIFKHSAFIPANERNSNNVAEYLAFKALLDWIKANHSPAEHSLTVQIWGDSKLVIMQMVGVWKMKGGYYIQTATQCKALLKELEGRGLNFMIAWHGRDLNAYADELSKAELVRNKVEFKIQPL